ncbi:MAG: SNF2-related protein [Actinomycetales bacterium]
MDPSPRACGSAARPIPLDEVDASDYASRFSTPSARPGAVMQPAPSNVSIPRRMAGGSSNPPPPRSRLGAAAASATAHRARPLVGRGVFIPGRLSDPNKRHEPPVRPPVPVAALRRPGSSGVVKSVRPISRFPKSSSALGLSQPRHGKAVLSMAPAAAAAPASAAETAEAAMNEAAVEMGEGTADKNALEMTDEDRAKNFAGADAEISKRDKLHKAYCERLLGGLSDITLANGKKGPRGLMSANNMLGEENVPYDHQRIAVKKFVEKGRSFLILGHDMGLGKTATLLQMYASLLCTLERSTVPKAIISVPSATLDQWLDTALDWLTIPRHRILVTTKAAEVTAAKLKTVDLVIVSRDCVANAFGKCYSRQEVIRETPRGNRKCVEWLRTPGTQLHPMFAPPSDPAKGWYGKWDMLGVDEAHVSGAPTPTVGLPALSHTSARWQYMRNADSRRCEAHHHISKLSTKTALLSGTFIVNGPLDLAGLCKCGNAPRAVFFEGKTYDLQDTNTWTMHRNSKTINKAAVRLLRKRFIDRATEKILKLPPIDELAVNFEAALDPETAARYNATLQEAKALKARIERQQNNRATAKDLTQLMALLQLLQQYLVSPVIARESAAAFKDKTRSLANPDKTRGQLLFEEATEVPSGSITALMVEIEDLMEQGHRRVVVASNHVTIMQVARLQIQSKRPQFGTCYMYEGGMSLKDRVATKKGFLKTQRGILFLSIGAGGVGLHLVPGCEAMLFWGSMPFSPAHRRQALKRIHRIGQTAPVTGKVTVRHLIAHGSVDNAIGVMHGDKDSLIQLVQEGDDSAFGGDEDSQWRKAGRIVDAALPVDETGALPPMPLCKIDANSGKSIMEEAFTLLPGVQTRGREKPTAVNQSRLQAPRNSASNLMSDDLDEELVPANQAPPIVIDSDDDDAAVPQPWIPGAAAAAPVLNGPPVVAGQPLHPHNPNLGPPPQHAVAAVQAAMAAAPQGGGAAAAITAIFQLPQLSAQQRIVTLQALGIMI